MITAHDIYVIRSLLDMWVRNKGTPPKCLITVTKDWIKYLVEREDIRVAAEGDI